MPEEDFSREPNVKNAKNLHRPEGEHLKAAEAPYIIALLNASIKWTCFKISFDKQNWTATPLVGRTCANACDDTGLKQCFDQGHYQPIATINCGRQVAFWLGFRDAQGNV